ncbi:Tad domain-containing protein [Novosphingobium flavum]|uniref:Tad domain-containing protein n=1 Tax=Novosphingobium flavum TaxID=1778672 RepID=A0A7X1FPE0_9SPHN|nr:Tad domain-containing protein [Novosphingobium flavum]MBC2664112.1 Tad domain-containing protein [Novosphingobium flavum]
MLGSILRALLKDTSANALVVSAFAMMSMIGGAGLATDTVQWTLWKRQLQRMADSAALSGAYALAAGSAGPAAATTELGRYSYITNTVTYNAMPTTGTYANNAMALRVALSTSRALPFSSLFMSSTPTITAEATGAAVGFGQYCVISLETTTATGVSFGGNTTATLGCGVATNSQGTTAVYAGGSSQVTASPISAVGNVPASSNYQTGTTLISYSIAQADPYASLPMMSVPNGCNQALSIGSNKTKSVNTSGNPATQCYTSMDIQGTANMDPGIYIINGGSFNIGAQAEVNCSGCVFLLTTDGAASTVATADINGGAKLNITAPTSGTYKGILFYQDRNAVAGTTNKINGNSSSVLDGAIYFPKQYVTFNGTTGMDTKCIQIVARQVTFTGNSTIQNNCTNSGSQSITGTQVRLVD